MALRSARLLAFAVLAIHAALLAAAATQHSPTTLEPANLAAGIHHWQSSRFVLYRVNPPLVRMVAALPVMAAGAEEDWSRLFDGPGARPEMVVGRDFVAANGERSIWLFTLARWACIPFSLVGGVFCYKWAAELWGRREAGLVALVIWCFDPNLLAHGELITPDCAAASLGLAAAYAFWRWLQRPTWWSAVLAGLALGTAQLCKASWLILFGLWPLLLLLWRVPSNRNSLRRLPLGGNAVRSGRTLLQLCLTLGIGLYLLNAGYQFKGTFSSLRSYTFVSRLMTSKQPGTAGNRFKSSWLGRLPVPLPPDYVLGLDLQKRDFENFPRPSYLGGQWRDGGWWYYYIYGMTVKMPHGTQFLLLISVALLGRYGYAWHQVHQHTREKEALNAQTPLLKDLVVLLSPPIALFTLASSQTGLNHHMRYVLPCYGFLAVLAASSVRLFDSRQVVFRVVVGACLCWSVCAGLRQHPHNLAYFNELSGGPNNGHKHLLGSNLDCAQDLIQLRKWSRSATPDGRVGYVGQAPYPLSAVFPEFEKLNGFEALRSLADGKKEQAIAFSKDWVYTFCRDADLRSSLEMENKRVREECPGLASAYSLIIVLR